MPCHEKKIHLVRVHVLLTVHLLLANVLENDFESLSPSTPFLYRNVKLYKY